MSVQSNDNGRLRIENELMAALNGDNLKNAMDFIAYMKASGMTPHAEHYSAFEYEGKWVCIIIIMDIDGAPGWVVFDNPLTKLDDFPLDEQFAHLKDFAWASAHVCGKCGCGSQPGQKKLIFGKEFDNICTSEAAFWNPDAAAVKNMISMIDIWKENGATVLPD
ncbi:MAG: hypothetical protein FWC71_07010 [Defluviitaleaceae bacterium]|nr:hypothetical protein [Defluviitaleaceae bacterium]